MCSMRNSDRDGRAVSLDRILCNRSARSGCYRLERPVAGWELHPLKTHAFARRTKNCTLRAEVVSPISWQEKEKRPEEVRAGNHDCWPSRAASPPTALLQSK